MLQWAGATAGLLAAPVWAVAGDKPVVVGVMEHRDNWTKLDGAAKLLKEAGLRVVVLDPAKPADQQGLDAVVFGSFSSESKGYRSFMQGHAASIGRFVAKGGVVLQFTQADQVEASPPFLPDGLSLVRGDADPKSVFALRRDHPLLTGLMDADKKDQLLLPAHRRTGGWESIDRFDGFAVLAARNTLRQHGVVLEAAHGKGRIVITALHFDRLFDADGELAASKDFYQQAKQFATNVGAYAALVRAGRAPRVEADQPYRLPEPVAYVDGAWTLAILPDTQVYSERHPQHFENQTKWIAEQAKAYRIQHALHLGDIVNRGNTQPKQWDNAERALKHLHGRVPLGIVPGNHDYDDNRGGVRKTQLNRIIPPKTLAQGKTLKALHNDKVIDNQALAFEVDGQKWLMLGLEFGPRDGVLDWAKGILKEYRDHRVVVFTHAYMYSDDTRYDHTTKKQNWNPSGYRLEDSFNDAEMMWQKVLKDASNVHMVLSGHVLNDGQAYLASKASAGHTVHQMLQNYQVHREGGEGYMRLLEFHPDRLTVQAKTYSPSLDKYKTDPANQFKFKLSV
ncbi:MAG: metallophosphoesterase [Phycisphaeraceae bacterium]|nr:metallophosphoesterase [Phycisphaeraceae bacterium]